GDRIGELPVVFDPSRACHLAVAIEVEPSREHRRRVVTAPRENGCDPGAHRSLTHAEWSRTPHNGRMPHHHALHVGDGVERAGRTIEGDAEVAGAHWSRLGGDGRGREEEKTDETDAHWP